MLKAKTIISAVIILYSFSCSSKNVNSKKETNSKSYIQLFDGNSLSGWKILNFDGTGGQVNVENNLINSASRILVSIIFPQILANSFFARLRFFVSNPDTICGNFDNSTKDLLCTILSGQYTILFFLFLLFRKFQNWLNPK